MVGGSSAVGAAPQGETAAHMPTDMSSMSGCWPRAENALATRVRSRQRRGGVRTRALSLRTQRVSSRALSEKLDRDAADGSRVDLSRSDLHMWCQADDGGERRMGCTKLGLDKVAVKYLCTKRCRLCRAGSAGLRSFFRPGNHIVIACCVLGSCPLWCKHGGCGGLRGCGRALD